MAGIVDRLERIIRQHVLRAMPAEGRASLESLSLDGLLIEYRAWRSRFIAPQQRNVHRSAELQTSPKAVEHSQSLHALSEKISSGEDLTPHLSKRIHRPLQNVAAPDLEHRTDRDALLADWGVHHLHLSANRRSDDVLLAMFSDGDAYLIGIYRHPKHANWAAEEIVAVIVRNWPRAGLVHESRFATGLPQHYSDEDRRALRNAGTNIAFEFDGKVYIPGGFGQTVAGTPMAATIAVNKLMSELQAWRDDDPHERLRRMKGAPSNAYWVPAVHLPRPGFEEYCGFQAGSKFCPVGRIC